MNPAEIARQWPRRAQAFTPVPRQTRNADGWTPERQRAFIEALAVMGSVEKAARAAGMSKVSAYRLRHAKGAESFVAAWDAAMHSGASRVYDVLIDHATNGVPEPIYYAGKQVGTRRRFNHLTMRWIVEKPGPMLKRGRAAAPSPEEAKRLRAELLARLDRLADRLDREAAAARAAIGDDPARRAAYELLNGAQDWDAA